MNWRPERLKGVAKSPGQKVGVANVDRKLKHSMDAYKVYGLATKCNCILY